MIILLPQAIQHGNLNKLHDSIRQMKKNAGSCPGETHCLDVCYFQSVLSPAKRRNTVYCMTLLAHAAVQRNKNMVDVLIKCGAGKKTHTV